jgi:hypothetical protein
MACADTRVSAEIHRDDIFSSAYTIVESRVVSDSTVFAVCHDVHERRPWFLVAAIDKGEGRASWDQLCRKISAYNHVLSLKLDPRIPSFMADLPDSTLPWTNWLMPALRPPKLLWFVTEFVQPLEMDKSLDPIFFHNSLIKSLTQLHTLIGIRHGDVSPTNLGIRRGGDDVQNLVLLDFGMCTYIGKHYGPRQFGQPPFMSMAQLRTMVPHPADDIESAVLVTLWLICGHTMPTIEERVKWMSLSGSGIEQRLRDMLVVCSKIDRAIGNIAPLSTCEYDEFMLGDVIADVTQRDGEDRTRAASRIAVIDSDVRPLSAPAPTSASRNLTPSRIIHAVSRFIRA